MNKSMISDEYILFKPEDAYRVGGRQDGSLFTGQNPLPGAVVCFYLKNKPGKDDNVRLDFMDINGELIRSFSTDTKGLETEAHTPYSKLETGQGMNIISWDLSYPGVLRVPGMILWGGYLGGPEAVPCFYKTRLTVNGESMEEEFQVLPDPNSSSSIADLQEQFDFIIEVRDKLTEIHQAILDIRKLRDDIVDVESKLDNVDHENILEMTGEIKKELTAVEEALYQTKNWSRQDPLNYPIKLGNKLAALNGVVATGDWKPTDQSYEVRDMLVSAIDIHLDRLEAIIKDKVPELNRILHENNIEYIKY